MEAMGNFLKLKRLEKGYTQEHLGALAEYSQGGAKQAISQIERGLSWIPLDKKDRLIRVLGLDPNTIEVACHHFVNEDYNTAIKILADAQKAEIKLKTQYITNAGMVPARVEQQPENAPISEANPEEKLEKLKHLFEKGLIPESLYHEKMKDILDKMF